MTNLSGQIEPLVASYLTHFRQYYPEILEWYSGIKDEFSIGRRGLFISWSGHEIQGLAITKNGPRAKLCHISVSRAARERGVGRALMQLAVRGMKQGGAKEILVTTSEDVFRSHGNFFGAAGFEVFDWQPHRYRYGTSELIWRMDLNSSKCHQKWVRSNYTDGLVRSRADRLPPTSVGPETSIKLSLTGSTSYGMSTLGYLPRCTLLDPHDYTRFSIRQVDAHKGEHVIGSQQTGNFLCSRFIHPLQRCRASRGRR